MARGKLTDKEKKYIEKYIDKGVDFLALKLGRGVATIVKYVETLIDDKPEEVVEEKSKQEEKQETLMSSQFARKKERGVVIMTENASIMSDERKKTRKTGFDTLQSKYKNCVHKISDIVKDRDKE